MKRIALIDYGSGNIHSAERALLEAATRAERRREISVTSDPLAIRHSDAIVLPGVGHFADCAENLRAKDGLVQALEEAVLKDGKPFLGICVGMQLLADVGREDGDTPGLGWIPGEVVKIDPGPDYRVPHMGWNEISLAREHAMLAGLGDHPHVYFTHSYVFRTDKPEHTLASANYGRPLAAAVGRDNIFGTQFHPEKSQDTGLKLLSNFMTWEP